MGMETPSHLASAPARRRWRLERGFAGEAHGVSLHPSTGSVSGTPTMSPETPVFWWLTKPARGRLGSLFASPVPVFEAMPPTVVLARIVSPRRQRRQGRDRETSPHDHRHRGTIALGLFPPSLRRLPLAGCPAALRGWDPRLRGTIALCELRPPNRAAAFDCLGLPPAEISLVTCYRQSRQDCCRGGGGPRRGVGGHRASPGEDRRPGVFLPDAGVWRSLPHRAYRSPLRRCSPYPSPTAGQTSRSGSSPPTSSSRKPPTTVSAALLAWSTRGRLSSIQQRWPSTDLDVVLVGWVRYDGGNPPSSPRGTTPKGAWRADSASCVLAPPGRQRSVSGTDGGPPPARARRRRPPGLPWRHRRGPRPGRSSSHPTGAIISVAVLGYHQGSRPAARPSTDRSLPFVRNTRGIQGPQRLRSA